MLLNNDAERCSSNLDERGSVFVCQEIQNLDSIEDRVFGFLAADEMPTHPSPLDLTSIDTSSLLP